jgi:hypothetical protein
MEALKLLRERPGQRQGRGEGGAKEETGGKSKEQALSSQEA